jgi:diketogulonate reductase-like aldo/keto reductase
VQQDIGVIPRTARIERLESNGAIFDFTLSDDEMARIGELARPRGRVVNFAYSGAPEWD